MNRLFHIIFTLALPIQFRKYSDDINYDVRSRELKEYVYDFQKYSIFKNLKTTVVPVEFFKMFHSDHQILVQTHILNEFNCLQDAINFAQSFVDAVKNDGYNFYRFHINVSVQCELTPQTQEEAAQRYEGKFVLSHCISSNELTDAIERELERIVYLFGARNSRRWAYLSKVGNRTFVNLILNSTGYILALRDWTELLTHIQQLSEINQKHQPDISWYKVYESCDFNELHNVGKSQSYCITPLFESFLTINFDYVENYYQ